MCWLPKASVYVTEALAQVEGLERDLQATLLAAAMSLQGSFLKMKSWWSRKLNTQEPESTRRPTDLQGETALVMLGEPKQNTWKSDILRGSPFTEVDLDRMKTSYIGMPKNNVAESPKKNLSPRRRYKFNLSLSSVLQNLGVKV